MSADSRLFSELERAREEIRRLTQRGAAMETKLNELMGGDRVRRFYPPDERRGRHVGRCEKCGQRDVVIVARGLCSACYARFYRKRRRDSELGGAPVKLPRR